MVFKTRNNYFMTHMTPPLDALHLKVCGCYQVEDYDSLLFEIEYFLCPEH